MLKPDQSGRKRYNISMAHEEPCHFFIFLRENPYLC